MSATNRAEQFDRDFEQFKSENPEWGKYMTDTSFYELMDWYDAAHHRGSQMASSDEARDFASYVCDMLCEGKHREMTVMRDGGFYRLENISEEGIRSLLLMIKGAGLPERRAFDRVKRQIEELT